MKKCFVLLLALCFSMTMTAALAQAYVVGDTMADFSVAMFDGKTYTLSEILKEKQVVVLNFWGSWCPPCQAEFPHFDEVYAEMKDDVEILALSSPMWDGEAQARASWEEGGYAFPMGMDTAELAQQFPTAAIPTTAIIDQSGTIRFLEAGMFPSAELFGSIVTSFMAEAELPAESEYVVKYVDEAGNPVPGVMTQLCTEGTCMALVADAQGVSAYVGETYPYEVHVLMVPAGYVKPEEAFVFPIEGGEMTITLVKE